MGTGNNKTIGITLVGEWGFSCGTGKIQSTLPFFLNFPSFGNFGQELTILASVILRSQTDPNQTIIDQFCSSEIILIHHKHLKKIPSLFSFSSLVVGASPSFHQRKRICIYGVCMKIRKHTIKTMNQNPVTELK